MSQIELRHVLRDLKEQGEQIARLIEEERSHARQAEASQRERFEKLAQLIPQRSGHPTPARSADLAGDPPSKKRLHKRRQLRSARTNRSKKRN